MNGRTYRFMTAEPLFPFGFGLSYARFAYSDLRLDSEQVTSGKYLSLNFKLANLGSVAAEEVAQVYLKDMEASVRVPFHKLVGFQRVLLQPGECRILEFTLSPAMMELIDEDGNSRLEPGRFQVTAGGCSPGPRGLVLGTPKPVSTHFRVD